MAETAPNNSRPNNCSTSSLAANWKALARSEFKDLDKLDIVGIYPNYATAYAAWKAKAQRTVDNAQMRYFIVHLHRLLDPQSARRSAEGTAGLRLQPSRARRRRRLADRCGCGKD